MQNIGLVGGMSWESSAEYYKLLNVGVEQRLGGLHSARTVMTSVEFAEITALQEEGRWDEVADLLTVAARGVQAAGADFLLLCTTAFHRVADQVEEAIDIPLLHLGDVVASAVKSSGFKKVALIGTSFSMEHPFFTERFARHGVEVIVPAEQHHEPINRIIYDELVHGKVLDSSRRTRRRSGRRALGRRRAGHHPGLHRAGAAGQAGRLRAAAVPVDGAACHRGAGPGPG